MSLSSENIQFIDNYLKNSEVIYYDIRMEMLDHVATAVEHKMQAENLDFYDAFKSYMVVSNYFSESFTIRNLFFVFMIILAFFQLVYFRLILKQRFFVLEKLGGLLTIIYYLQMFFMNQHKGEKPSVFTLTLFSYITIAYLLYFIREVYKFNTNKKQYVL